MADQSRLEIVIDSRRAERNLRNVRNELRGVETVGVSSMSALRTAALAATGALAALGVGAGLSSAIADIRDFQAEMSGLRAVTLASAADMERLESQARRLGATTAFGANQAAQAQRFLAQAGMSTNEVLGSTPQVLQLAQAGMLDLASAADLATDIMGQMGLGVEDLSRISDVLIATSQSATTDVTQLGQAFSMAGPIAKVFGLSLEDTAAALGVISSSGVKASRAGTGLLGTLRQLATMTPKAEAALGNYDLSLSDVDVAARGIVPVLRDLSAAGIGGADALKIFGSEAATSALALMEGFDAFEQQTQSLRELDGVAANAAKTMTDNLGGAIKGLGSAISEANLQLGDSGLTGALSGTITAATGVVQVVNGMQAEWAAANDISADYVGTLETVAMAAQLTATAVGVRLATAVGTATSAKIRDTAASINNARAEAAAAQAVTRRTGAELASARAMLSSIRLEEQATRGTSAHAFALNALSAARVRATNAAGAHGLATTNATAAMARASVAARGLSGAMALVGGPVGVALLAAAGLFAFREELGLVPAPVEAARDEIDLLVGSMEDLGAASIDAAMISINAQMFELERRARQARAEIDRINDEQNVPGPLRNSLVGPAGGARRELTGIQAEQSAMSDRREELLALREGLDAAGAAGDGTADALGRLGTAADDLAEKFKPMLDDDVQDILDRAGPGARIDESGQLRDAFGNFLPTMQRDLDRVLKDQVDAFSSEQNLQAGLEAAAEKFLEGAVEAAAQAWGSVAPQSANEVAGRAEAGGGRVMATREQDSAPERTFRVNDPSVINYAPAGGFGDTVQGSVGSSGPSDAAPKPRGSVHITVSKDGSSNSGEVEGDDAFIKQLTDALSGAASAS